MRWLKVIKINSDKECMIAIFSFLLSLIPQHYNLTLFISS